jgi:peptidyl-tRNA hydrolase, PTH1 family
MKLIVGLGNPGEKYEDTRHNLGFMVVDHLASDNTSELVWETQEKLKSEVVKTPDVIFAKPQTYMNNSGQAVKLLTGYYKISPEDVIVIHDDLDLMLGKIKVRQGGAAAGHHGVESIIDAIGDSFWRVRIGIGNEKSHLGEHQRQSFEAEKFVIEPFLSAEKHNVKHMIKQVLETIDREFLTS